MRAHSYLWEAAKKTLSLRLHLFPPRNKNHIKPATSRTERKYERGTKADTLILLLQFDGVDQAQNI